MARKVPAINASSMADISFLLLIFFLITTSMDVSQGLSRQLPPIPQEKDNQKKEDLEINKRNILIVKVNSFNDLLVNGEEFKGTEEERLIQLRKAAKDFIENPTYDPELPDVVTDTVAGFSSFGKVRYTPEHIISVRNDVDTRYQSYLSVQNELVAAYNELRDAFVMKQFGVPSFKELKDEAEKSSDPRAQEKVAFVEKVYQMKISEAEPKDYNKK